MQRPWPDLRYNPGICVEGLKVTNTLIQIAGIQAEIWTRDLSNKKQCHAIDVQCLRCLIKQSYHMQTIRRGGIAPHILNAFSLSPSSEWLVSRPDHFIPTTGYYGVRLHLWTAATSGHIGHPLNDMSFESDGGMILTGENRRTRRKTCPSVTLSTTNPTWIDPGTNPGFCGDRPATNDLNHGMAPQQCQYDLCAIVCAWKKNYSA
jgi:hypothetical protein